MNLFFFLHVLLYKLKKKCLNVLEKRLIATEINIIINVKMSIADLNDDNEKIVLIVITPLQVLEIH